MDSKQEDKFGMFLKVDSFLGDHATDLSVNIAFADIKIRLAALIEKAVQADSTATRNLTGLNTDKKEKRKNLEIAILTIAAACRGYYTTNHDPYKKALVKLTPTDVFRMRDTELIKQADQVHDVADPIKANLTPWVVADTDVDDLLTLVNTYRPALVKGTRETDISGVAGTQVDVIFADIDKLLREEADDQMAVYEFTNNPLFLEYKLARAIDDSGGNSGTDGYEVVTYIVPPSGSLIIPVGDAPIPAQTQFYARAINGSVVACTTDLPASPCVSGYQLAQGVTFKDEIGAMGLDLSKPNFQLTNPGFTAVTVRAGVKLKE